MVHMERTLEAEQVADPSVEQATKEGIADLPTPSKRRLTTAEYLALPESNLPTELVQGEVITIPSPDDARQVVTGNTYTEVRTIARQFPGSRTRISPVDVWFEEGEVRQPDVLWVRADSDRCVLRDGVWYGAPDLSVEVWSPGTKRRARGEKFDLYEKHGVREYWMLDPVLESVEQWLLKDDIFEELGTYRNGETFNSPTLGGAAVEVAALFART